MAAVLSYFLSAVANVLNVVLNTYFWVLLIRAILSWVNPDPYNPIVQFLHSITDPLLRWIRRYVPPFGMIDFSVWIAALGILFLQNFIVGLMFHFAKQLAM